MVTSPLSGDGKSTTALNLTARLAAAGERVILIDADTEGPSLSSTLGIRTTDGLGRLLAEHTPLVDALVPVRLGTNTMYVLPAEPSSYEGLTDSAAVAVLEEASAFADWVVVDLPPLSVAPAALPLARAATELLLAVRLRHTNMRDLGRLAELLMQQRLMPAGFVVTGTSGNGGVRHAVVVTGPASEPSPSHTTDGAAAGRTIPHAPVVPG